jgi:hypothetical protein
MRLTSAVAAAEVDSLYEPSSIPDTWYEGTSDSVTPVLFTIFGSNHKNPPGFPCSTTIFEPLTDKK